MKSKIILLLLGLILSIGTMQAELAVSLNVATAGTLSTLINSSKKDSITSLTLTGYLNGDDIRYLREMAGSDVNGQYISSGKLSVLDISGSNIVNGGGYYYNSYNSKYKTSDNMISDYMFYDCEKLTSVSIPSNVNSIGSSAFRDCNNMTTITLPSSLISIKADAFSQCYYLTTVTFPSSLKYIGNGAFNSCLNLKSITIPENVTYIGSYAFANCSKLTQFIVDSKNSKFSSLEGVLCNKDLTKLIAYPNRKSSQYTIPNSITSIGPYAFNGSDIKSITIPDNVITIDTAAFSNCWGLTTITLPNSLKRLESYVFQFCPELTSVTLPSSVTSIGFAAFYYCSGLISVTIPNSVTIIEMHAFQHSGLTSVNIPSSVTSIEDEAFYECTRLTSVTIPNSVTSIGYAAFGSCTGLTSVTIPGSVTSIGESAFSDCLRLNEIHCQMKTPPSIIRNVFLYVNKSTCKLYVPKGSYRSYWLANTWGDFTNIIEEEVTPLDKIRTSNASVYTERNNIIVKGINEGEVISVFTTMGTLLKTVEATNDVRINVPSNQIYLVRIENKTFKVAL